MGLLKDDEVHSWQEILETKNALRERGVQQFIKAYHTHKNTEVPHLAFGDELELITVRKDEDGRWRLLLGSDVVANDLGSNGGISLEFASYMIEISAEIPYDMNEVDETNDIANRRPSLIGLPTCLSVEDQNVRKIQMLKDYFKSQNIVAGILLMPVFPDISAPFMSKSLIGGDKIDSFNYDITHSDAFPDEAITPHNRFIHFTQNIAARRGRFIEGYAEVMIDPDDPRITEKGLPQSYIKIDTMGQGMGLCCLQTTVQARTLDEGRFFHDVIAVMSPILLRITAASPIAQGKLLNTETRWDMLCMSVDCRTDEERGGAYELSGPAIREKSPTASIFKSRCSSVDLFVSNSKANLKEYNDIHPPLNQVSYEHLLTHGVDDLMAQHIASLFIRDPVVSYKYKSPDSAIEARYDFENIQSSNWRSVRLKLPDEKAKKEFSGFKVETRSMELQATIFENAAFVYLNFLLSRAAIEYNCNFYIPISLVDENFVRSNLCIRHKNEYFSTLGEDRQKLYYRSNIFESGPPVIREGTINEIFNGNTEIGYCGILSIVRKIMSEKFTSIHQFSVYIDFIEKKARGVYMTLADWQRRFVFTHKAYKNDSIVSDVIIDDLLENMLNISTGNDIHYLLNE